MLAELPAPPLAARDVTVEFGGVKILDNVSFRAGPGCLMVVVGPNGAGKSTLFNVITSLIPATSGQVLIHGKPMTEMRGTVAYVPQYERVNSRIPMSAWDVVMQGRVRRIGWFHRAGRADRAAAEEALRRVGMWERRTSLVHELSGGQRQRVFVAQGNRVLTKHHFQEVVLTPACLETFALDAGFQAGLLLEQVVRNLPKRSHVLGSVVFADPALVFAEGHVQGPVQ